MDKGADTCPRALAGYNNMLWGFRQSGGIVVMRMVIVMVRHNNGAYCNITSKNKKVQTNSYLCPLNGSHRSSSIVV